MTGQTPTLDEVEALACAALLSAGVSAPAAAAVVPSRRAAERDGTRSHGLI